MQELGAIPDTISSISGSPSRQVILLTVLRTRAEDGRLIVRLTLTPVHDGVEKVACPGRALSRTGQVELVAVPGPVAGGAALSQSLVGNATKSDLNCQRTPETEI